ncbi:hypothetical protein QUF87_21465 [Lysinibacillus pakistanensis]|nr:hypothetical protein [Lysinibacillus pakistanensis]
MMVVLMKPTPEDTIIDRAMCSAVFFLYTTSLIPYSDYTFMSVSFSIIILYFQMLGYISCKGLYDNLPIPSFNPNQI